MKKRIRAIQFGCGLMAATILRYLDDHGVEIVGAIDINPEVVGKDVGEFAKLGREIGVKISDNAEEVLSSSAADIAIVTTFSYMKEMYPFLEQCASHGLNVITIGDEAIFPWFTSPAETNRLDRLAKDKGVTIFGTGMQDVFWVNLPTLIASGLNKIESIHGTISYNVEDYGLAGIDFTASDLDFNRSRELGMYLWNSGWNAAEALAVKLGLTISSIRQQTVPFVLEEDMISLTLQKEYKKGETIGMSITTYVTTQQGISLEVECIAKVFTAGEGDLCEWTITGEPTVNFSVTKPMTVEHTCATVVNRIPSVIKAEPGYVTVDFINENPEYLAHPIQLYL